MEIWKGNPSLARFAGSAHKAFVDTSNNSDFVHALSAPIRVSAGDYFHARYLDQSGTTLAASTGNFFAAWALQHRL
jgi:hypothetical protein